MSVEPDSEIGATQGRGGLENVLSSRAPCEAAKSSLL